MKMRGEKSSGFDKRLITRLEFPGDRIDDFINKRPKFQIAVYGGGG